MEGFLGEEGCVPHRGMAYCSPRKIIYIFKENAYHLKIYAVLWRITIFNSFVFFLNLKNRTFLLFVWRN